MANNPILRITDGTTEINLADNGPIRLTEPYWRPGVSDYKGGGTWQDSPLAEGRRLRDARYAHVVESIPITVRGPDQDVAARRLQELLRLNLKGDSYDLADWQDTPVYLVAQGACETNPRYALIHRARVPELPDLYGQPFFSAHNEAVLTDLTLIVEREHWQDVAPGQSTAIQASSQRTFNSITYGQEATTSNYQVFVANKNTYANISHVFRLDAGVGFTDITTGPFPVELLPNPAGVGDTVYFGIDSTILGSAPFSSLVFDIGTPMAGTYTIVWSFSIGGAGWTPFAATNLADGTDVGGVFGNQGVCPVTWTQNTLDGVNPWATDAVNGVTAWWIKAEITAITTITAIPTQQNRRIYTVTNPFVDIDDAQVGGDITAIAKLILRNWCGTDTLTQSLYSQRIVAGLRSLDRGSNFTAYINMVDTLAHPTGMTFNYLGGTASTADVQSPLGTVARMTLAAPSVLADRITIDLNNTLGYQFYGTYHVFLRVKVDASGGGAAASDLTFRLKVQLAERLDLLVSNEVSPDTITTDRHQIVDFGLLSIPGTTLIRTDEPVNHLRIVVQSELDAGTITVDFIDLILIPVDEWAADLVLTGDATDILGGSYYLQVDSTIPKLPLRAVVKDVANDEVFGLFDFIGSPAMLQANADQRLWFFAFDDLSPSTDTPYELIHTVQASIARRYLALRGDR